ncbi:MAG: hypothetical protein V3V45_02120, partial [Candidatus Brocadiales bacterium]
MVISKRRIALFSVLGCLLFLVLLSMLGVIPNRYSVKRVTDMEDTYKGRSYTELQEAGGETEVRQYISNFYLPRYDETGKEVFTIRGREAFLINDM